MATNRKIAHPHWLVPVAAIALVAVSQFATAQESPGVTVDVDKCLGLEKRDERLACFDAQVEAAKRAPAPAQDSAPAAAGGAAVAGGAAAAASSAPAATSSAPAAASSAPVPPPPAPEATFGEKGPRKELEPELVAKIADLHETVPNQYVITLDNGQVWRQQQSMIYPLREGMDVRLKQTRFGYRLTAPELRGQISVERVR